MLADVCRSVRRSSIFCLVVVSQKLSKIDPYILRDTNKKLAPDLPQTPAGLGDHPLLIWLLADTARRMLEQPVMAHLLRIASCRCMHEAGCSNILPVVSANNQLRRGPAFYCIGDTLVIIFTYRIVTYRLPV